MPSEYHVPTVDEPLRTAVLPPTTVVKGWVPVPNLVVLLRVPVPVPMERVPVPRLAVLERVEEIAVLEEPPLVPTLAVVPPLPERPGPVPTLSALRNQLYWNFCWKDVIGVTLAKL